MRRRLGFTLIESMATVVILGALGSTSSLLIVTSVNSLAEAAARLQMHGELSIAMDRIIREIRDIPLDSAAVGVAPDINTADDANLQWDDTVGAAQIITSGSTITLAVKGNAANVLLTDVTQLDFDFDDEDDAALGALPRTGASCDAIRRVKVLISLTRTGWVEELEATVYIRSCMVGS